MLFMPKLTPSNKTEIPLKPEDHGTINTILQSKRKSNLRIIILLSLLIIGVGLSGWYFLSRSQTKIDLLHLSGRVEGYETDIGAKNAGRVNFIAVREGDRVRKNQVLVELDDAEMQAKLQGAKARLLAAKKQVIQAQLQIEVISSQITEAQLNLQQSRGDAQGRINQAQANVAAAQAQLNQAQAQLNQAQAELKLAAINRDRYTALFSQGAITQQQLDQAQTNFDTALGTILARKASVNAASQQVGAAQGKLMQVKTTGLNPEIRNAQLDRLRKQQLLGQAQLAATQAEVGNFQAAQEEIAAQIAYLKVKSPIDGVVTVRTVEPGAVVASGKTLLTLVNPDTIYLRGYIPGGEIGKVRVGQPAKVFLDSFPNQAFSAHVTAIDPQASFTPENIYFRQERVKQVFGVKITIDNPGGFAKPGMPADAEIVIQRRQS
jgi:HlyD family secretion protein